VTGWTPRTGVAARPNEKTPLKHLVKRMVNQWQKKTGIARENMPVMGREYPGMAG
jgi:hypothetical protein